MKEDAVTGNESVTETAEQRPGRMLSHNEGVGTNWTTPRAFWVGRPANEAALRANQFSARDKTDVLDAVPARRPWVSANNRRATQDPTQ